MILLKLLVRVVLRGWTTLDVHASSWCLEWKVCGDFVSSLEPRMLFSQYTYTRPISLSVLLVILFPTFDDAVVGNCKSSMHSVYKQGKRREKPYL